jgi:hypothetical protein
VALPRLTYARVKSTRKVGETTLLDIAVQTENGEIHPGEIVAGGYVTADSLIVGMLAGRDFKPMRQASGRQASADIVFAKITGASSVGYGEYEYQWIEVEPSDTPGAYTAVDSGLNSTADGPIRNTIESPNVSGGTLGSGIDSGTLPAGFDPVPVGDNAVVWVRGPYGSESDPWWAMCVSTHVDGSCGGAA